MTQPIAYYDAEDRSLYCPDCVPEAAEDAGVETYDFEIIRSETVNWQDYDEERSCCDCGVILLYTEDEQNDMAEDRYHETIGDDLRDGGCA